MKSCDLLKIYYLCGSSNSRWCCRCSCGWVVICLKFTTFVVAATVRSFSFTDFPCCDLLKIYYLCGSSNSWHYVEHKGRYVVICLKFTTFVVAATVLINLFLFPFCCDLLKIYYLCGSSNSGLGSTYTSPTVVICLKFTTFVVAATVEVVNKVLGILLWFA